MMSKGASVAAPAPHVPMNLIFLSLSTVISETNAAPADNALCAVLPEHFLRCHAV